MAPVVKILTVADLHRNEKLYSELAEAVTTHREWTDAIEDYSPWLVIFGHDHETPIRTRRWHCTIGQTTCVNVGQTDRGPLRYCLVELTYVGQKPSLPQHINLSAFPGGEVVVFPKHQVKNDRK